MSVVNGGWNIKAYLDELGGFPSSAHDDQVDASSRAFTALIARPGAMNINPDAIAMLGAPEFRRALF